MTELSQQDQSGGGAPMKEKAADTADAAKQAAGDVTHTAADKAKDVAGEAQRQAQNLFDQARDQLNDQVSAQHRNLVENLTTLGDEFRRMADASEQPGMAADLVGQAGDRARGAADWIGSRRPGDLVDEVRSFARRRPGAFLAGALIAGIAAGRLTRGAVAEHTGDTGRHSSADRAGADVSETQAMPSANATGYSSPPVHQGLPTGGEGSAYGVPDPSGITSGMPSSNVTPPETFPRPPQPPAPGWTSS